MRWQSSIFCFLLPLSKFFAFSSTLISAEEERKKNVLFLISDEHSGRRMKCAGDEMMSTPNLNELARSGVMFNAAYVQNPVCVPSRASLATGRIPSNVGVFGNYAHKDDVLRDTPFSVAKRFVEAGYIAEWLGKEHWGTDNAGLGFGDLNTAIRPQVHERAGAYNKNYSKSSRLPQDAFIYGQEIMPEKDTVISDFAMSWLDAYNGSQPFFFGVSLIMPHFPYMIQQKYYDKYKNVIDVPRVTPEMLADLPTSDQKRRKKFNISNVSEEEIKKARAIYYGMISYTDHQMGRIIKKLKEKGLHKDTIIVYVSDHGEMAGQHGLWYKQTFYEDSVTVPVMISYPPDIPARKRIHSPVQLMDIMPTLFELCNITIPSYFEGKSLMPIVRGEEDGWNRFAISETFDGLPGRMIRWKNWKYCWYQDGRNQLFNLRKDPAEEHNLCGDPKYAKVVQWFHKTAMDGYVDRNASHPSLSDPTSSKTQDLTNKRTEVIKQKVDR